MKIRLKISIKSPKEAAKSYELTFAKTRITLGRDKNNDVNISLVDTSRHHAAIFSEQGDWFIEDLHSSHGTKVDGHFIGNGGVKLLQFGSVIQFSHVSIIFLQDSQSEQDSNSSNETPASTKEVVNEVFKNLDADDKDIQYFRIMNGPKKGIKIKIGPKISEYTIGRDNSCDIQLTDSNISRKHMLIRRDWDNIYIEDLNSKNHIVVNNKKITQKYKLNNGDEIYLGSTHLTFIDPSCKMLGSLAMPDKKQYDQDIIPQEEAVDDELSALSKKDLETPKPIKSATTNKSNITAATAAISSPKTEYKLLSLAFAVGVGLVVSVLFYLDIL